VVIYLNIKAIGDKSLVVYR